MPKKPLWIIEERRRLIVKGNAKLVLAEGGFRGLYVGTVKGWILDRERLPDLLAYLDHRRVPYTLTERQGAA
jgi:hypothetical protein